MSNDSISCHNLGKKYRIGERERYRALRDTLTDALYAPLRRFRSTNSRNGSGGNNDLKTFWALKDVSFNVQQGEVVGIIGHNGAGKSTLLKILSRITKPTEGYVTIKGRVGSLLEVGTGFHPELSGRENIFLNGTILGMKKREIESKFDEIVAFAEVERFLDTPVKRYSSGMYVRLAFAVAAHLEPEILVVDEVLAVGDAAFQKKCLGKMGDIAKNGRTVLFVSHNMGAVRNLCSSAILLISGQIHSQGAVEEIVQNYLVAAYSEKEGYINLAERQDRSGSGRVRVISFQSRTDNDAEGVLQAGNTVEFVVKYSSARRQPVSKLYVGIAIKDVIGNSVLACSTSMTNSDFYGVPSEGEVICRIERLPLIPDRYYVDVKILDGEGLADQITNAASFEVTDSNNSDFISYGSRQWGGSVRVPHKWTLKPV